MTDANPAHPSSRDTERDALRSALLLDALSWILRDDSRRARFLDLTGLDGDALRTMVGTPALDDAVLRFLEGHEADFIACAQALGHNAGSFAALVRTAPR